MSASTPAEMSQTDQLFEMVLARQNTLEAVLMLLWDSHPDRESIRTAAKLVIEARAANDLNDHASELALAIRANARQATLDAVFHEIPSASADVDSHKP